MERKEKPNRFLDEIREQPEALKKTWKYLFEEEGRDQLTRAVQACKDKKSKGIIFTGMGSSFFISNLASGILNHYGIPSIALNTGELIHYQYPVIAEGYFLVIISQSGESYEITNLLDKLPEGIVSISLTNEPQSSLAGKTSLVLLSKAGREYMTSTKTFTSLALVAVILSLSLAGQLAEDKMSQAKSVITTLNDLITDPSAWLPGAMSLLRGAEFIQLVGRGPSMAAVQQGALMFMEGARKPASALLSGEFRHGPMELVKKGFLIIILAPGGETYRQHLKLAEDIVQFGGSVIFLSDTKPPAVPQGMLFINTPCSHEDFFSIPGIIPLQYMVNECALEKGYVPGEFLRGSKVTTIE